MKSIRLLTVVVALVTMCGPGCKSAKVVSERDYSQSLAQKPSMIYVADFEIWAQNIKVENGLLSGRPGPVGTIGARLSGKSSDPAVRARQIVELMASSLVKELTKAGFKATRLPPGASYPTEGWLLRGIFTQVDEGNRLRRSMIGFGDGQTDVQVVAGVQNLSQGPPKPLYEIATDASSGDKPGAAPTLVLGPYGAAARFVMAGQDLDKNVKQTAVQIAERMAKRVQQPN